ncbi:MAG: GNAT family N-acetyltransferase [Candidatus Nanopelagicales bacterium]
MTITVRSVEGDHRYEIRLHGRTAGYAEYTETAEVRTFTHTVIDSEFAGRGLGSQLIAGALDSERAAGRRIRATCPFVTSFLERHPDYRELLLSRTEKSA